MRNRTLGRETSHGRVGGRTRESIDGARELRREMTPAEQVLWRALRRHQLAGLHFRRQHPVGPFVLDFACAAERLGIEVDGAIHEAQKDQDQARTDILAEYGWRMIRFTNDEVMNELSRVLAAIEAAATAPSPSLTPPAPLSEGRASPDSGRGELAPNASGPADSSVDDARSLRNGLPSPRVGGGAGGGGR